MDFTKVYNSNYDTLKGVAFRYLKNEEDAEDAVQETFIKASQRVHTFRNDSALRTWLTSVCIRVCLDKKRADGRRIQMVSMPSDASIESIQPNNSPSPEALFLAEESEKSITDKINELPEHLRTVAELRWYKGMSYAEIAKTTDTPVGTVRTWLHRAKKRIMCADSPQ